MYVAPTWKWIVLRKRGNGRFRRKARASKSKMKNWKILWSSAVNRSRSCNISYCRERSTEDGRRSSRLICKYDHLQSSGSSDIYDHSNSDFIAKFFKKTLFLHHNIPPQTKEGSWPKLQKMPWLQVPWRDWHIRLCDKWSSWKGV